MALLPAERLARAVTALESPLERGCDRGLRRTWKEPPHGSADAQRPRSGTAGRCLLRMDRDVLSGDNADDAPINPQEPADTVQRVGRRLLTGKMRHGQPAPQGSRPAKRPGYVRDEKLDRVEALADWAQGQGLRLLQVAIGGLAAQQGCTSVIAGAMSPSQVRENAEAGLWQPSADQLAEIDKIAPPPGSGR